MKRYAFLINGSEVSGQEVVEMLFAEAGRATGRIEDAEAWISDAWGELEIEGYFDIKGVEMEMIEVSA